MEKFETPAARIFSAGEEPGHGLGGSADGGFGIGAVEVVEVDVVGPEAAEAFIALLEQGFGAAVADLFAVRAPVDSAFSRDHDFVAVGAEDFSDHLFAFAFVAVAVGGVEEVDSGVVGGGDELRGWRPV